MATEEWCQHVHMFTDEGIVSIPIKHMNVSKATACHLGSTSIKKRHDLAVGRLAFGGISSGTMALGNKLSFPLGLGPSLHRFGNEALSAIANRGLVASFRRKHMNDFRRITPLYS
jgi:hypothetical protein